jgi:hypothetical protein
MADIFNSFPGVVAVFSDDRTLPGRVQIVDEELNVQTVLISAIDYKQAVNKQFQQSLDGDIYVYIFGDLMGEVQVLGIAFPTDCQGSDEGMQGILQYYQRNRASSRETPVRVQLGKETIAGFLTAMTLSSPNAPGDPNSFMYTWSLVINALPKKD